MTRAWKALLVLACAPLVSCQTGGQAAQPSPAAVDCIPPPLQRADFPQTPRVDNQYRPLLPGMQFQLEGVVVSADGTRHPHRIETTVTGLTKLIDGVNALVIFERDYHDGRMAESELAFVAQDNRGSVWNMGEYPEIYDATGQLLGAPAAWLSGVAGGRAGVEMPGSPRVGDPPFAEGIAPDVSFMDCGTIFQSSQRVCVRGQCRDGVLVIDEYAPHNKKEGHQRKFYAPGVGTIKVAAVGGADAEDLELTSATKLCREDFAAIQALALAEDTRAFKAAKDIYSGYPPAKLTLDPQLC